MCDTGGLSADRAYAIAPGALPCQPVQSVIPIFANPISGAGRGRQVAERLLAAIKKAGWESRLHLDPIDTIKPESFAQVAGAASLLIIGGDGTVRAVVARLIRELPLEEIPPILIVPVGTANLLGRHLGINWRDAVLETQVVQTLRRRNILHLDAASANGNPFLIVGGVGLDAEVVHELSRIRSGPLRGRWQYIIPALKSLSREPFKALTVRVDGQTLIQKQRAMVFVGNIREYGTGFSLLPHARPDDGLLDICVIPCQTLYRLFLTFLMASMGEHLAMEQVLYAKGRQIMIESTEPSPVQIDGEAAGFTPVNIHLLPVRVPFIVPSNQQAGATASHP